MEKISFSEMEKRFCEYNRTHSSGCIEGVIVYSSDNWPGKFYSLESRSYRVTSDNKAFKDGMGGYSIFGSCLDGTDPCIRLEHIGWKIEHCYMLEVA